MTDLIPIGDTVAARIGALNERLQLADIDDIDALPDVLAAIHEVVTGLPRVAVQDFDAVSEGEIRRRVARRRQLLGTTGSLWVDPDSTDALLEAIVLMRAVEEIMVQFDRAIESDRSDELEDACRTRDGRHYVLRRVRGPTDLSGKPLLRRALLAHRVIPTRAGGLRVRLYRSRPMASAAAARRLRAAEQRSFGAAFFPGMNVILSPGDGDFTIQGLTGFDAAPLIAQQIRDARREACSGLVWAELTMDGQSVDVVRAELARQGMENGSRPDFVVTGSRHERVGDTMRNVATVMDGTGELLFDLFKWARFNIGPRWEGITAGSEIPLLITEGQLSVMAICRDFLDDGEQEPPYCRLDVDLAIVPSMAPASSTEATMMGHAATAQTMRHRYATQTLVVLQPPEAAPGSVGRVLPFPDRPLAAPQGQSVDASWHLCPLAPR
ncbi:hypothetical protein QH494_24900 [Sphingomonas sp. AR_OL41]|uniref:hypothetical protein n=1 Tax=Sphingomonas sp. AR_OL41 TaxID=3042729 RepID=UPI002480371E|nr:hypothetical protein [Sphingomonas sp. AR_OL41]MDH7975439.1 hypothetical protein [Sphingomonas sp. AR_OL41]